MLEQVSTVTTQYVFRPSEEEKRELSEIYAVPEYWAIKPQQKEIEVFKLGKGSDIYAENQILTTSFLPKFKLKVKNLFAD